ncbi:MAG: BolA family transcriptional regulator [Gammaproteobacteria bacterium]|nr:BolA family transcriptional regulator [Gammaproteobacteria bacterium]
MTTIQQEITQILQIAFEPSYLTVENESHMHAVAPGSESHFKVTIVSEQFDGLLLIKRHRAVNEKLRLVLEKIHALALHTMTAKEWSDKEGQSADSPLCMGGGQNQ